MWSLFKTSIFAVCVAAVFATKPYGSVDVEKLLADDNVLTGLINCLLDEGPCGPEGQALKDDAPAIMKQSCSGCSPEEKNFIVKSGRFIKQHRPGDWDRLNKKYNPTGEYTENFKTLLKGQ